MIEYIVDQPENLKNNISAAQNICISSRIWTRQSYFQNNRNENSVFQ